MAARGGSKVVMAAVKGRGPKFQASSSSKAKVKGKGKTKPIVPSASSELGKFLNIAEPARSETSKLISKFIKLNNRQNPGMKKDLLGEEKLKSILAGKDRIGIPEIAKLLSGQFVKTG
ncbi:Upstream activation factor subunit spp27 like [Melia azedarach]|uniref:Upstream activation factor subunit spp27 like n=1 Tax=Melia azedarach TaxID=155640 RepID=A0ACC1X8I6_MELAZ|nr:Upstream activation factor subunit spp27 like [Melia azedarach]